MSTINPLTSNSLAALLAGMYRTPTQVASASSANAAATSAASPAKTDSLSLSPAALQALEASMAMGGNTGDPLLSSGTNATDLLSTLLGGTAPGTTQSPAQLAQLAMLQSEQSLLGGDASSSDSSTNALSQLLSLVSASGTAQNPAQLAQLSMFQSEQSLLGGSSTTGDGSTDGNDALSNMILQYGQTIAAQDTLLIQKALAKAGGNAVAPATGATPTQAKPA